MAAPAVTDIVALILAEAHARGIALDAATLRRIVTDSGAPTRRPPAGGTIGTVTAGSTTPRRCGQSRNWLGSRLSKEGPDPDNADRDARDGDMPDRGAPGPLEMEQPSGPDRYRKVRARNSTRSWRPTNR